MKNSFVRSFWIGFAVTAGLTLWIYWILRQRREVLPEPLVVTRPPSPAAVSKTSASAVPHRLVFSEPLEEIKGIGPVFANRLNDAGIFTFSDLAAATPAELREITGVTRSDPADWIAEAEKLAKSD